MTSSYYIIYVVCTVCAFVPAIVFHEVAHGFAAWRLGDPTAKANGRLSLNPLRHIDPFGTVVLPLLLLFIGGPIFGYAKPVPYNPTYFKDPRKGDLIVGLAGPAANLAMALVGAAAMWLVFGKANSVAALGDVTLVVWMFLELFVMINLYLMFFNLLPIPPLDGSSIIACFIPMKHLPKYYKVQQYALPIFLILLFVLPYLVNVDLIGLYLNVTAGNLASVILP